MKPKHPTPELYLAFPKAIAALRDRINGTTSREIACWIFFGHIKAYGHVHEFQVPPEINLAGLALTDWPSASKEYPPFITALEAVFFLIADVDDFNPPSRYIAFADLLQRWMPHRENKESTANFIQSRIHQSRLHDFAPWLGETELSRVFHPSLPDDLERPRPPAEWAMFELAEVTAIEATDFPAAMIYLANESTSGARITSHSTTDHTDSPGPKEYGPSRDEWIFKRVKKLRASRSKAFLRTVAAEIGCSVSAIKQAIARHEKNIDTSSNTNGVQSSTLEMLQAAAKHKK